MDEKEILKELGLLDEEEGKQEEQKQDMQEEKKETEQQAAQSEAAQEKVPAQSEPAPQQENKEQEMPGANFEQQLVQAFEAITGRKFNPSNPGDVVIINQIAQQLQKQQAVMDYLQKAVDPKFDAWLEEKIKTLPYNEVASFQQAVANGDLGFVQQWIETKKKEYLGEADNKEQEQQKQKPVQATEHDLQEEVNAYGDLLSPEELQAIKELL